MKTRIHSLFLVPALLAFCILHSALSTAQAQGTAFTYQGQLNSNGVPANGFYDFQFTLYANAAGSGSPITGTFATNALGVTNGLFSAALDFGAVFTGNPTWLAMSVRSNGVGGYTALTPLQPLRPVPYAIYSASAGSANSVPAADLTGVLSSAQLPANYAWNLTGNAGTSPAGGNFLGTSDNEPFEVHVNGARALRLEPGSGQPNVIGGASSDVVAAGVVGATIAGGFNNKVNANDSTVGGGYNNTASGLWSTVAGGDGNTASGPGALVGGGGYDGSSFSANTATGGGSTVAGGVGNAASQADATVGGGAWNQANGIYATVSGGTGNKASGPGSFVGGGGWDGYSPSAYGNTASGKASTVAGGLDNTAGYDHDTVGGGWDNTASGGGSTASGGVGNTASGSAATVGGGWDNTASGGNATVGGGYNNFATNTDATVPGGYFNIAGGLYSFAAGQQAMALHQGDFVWADSQNGSYSSWANDQFCIRAQGGVQLDPTTSLSFGSATRQMVNLYGTTYGLGVQTGALFFRSDGTYANSGSFSWFRGGSFNSGQNNPGAGGLEMMRLETNGNLIVSSNVTARTISCTNIASNGGYFQSTSGNGVVGSSTSGDGAVGNSTSANGVVGGSTSGNGVVGNSTSGIGGVFSSLNGSVIFAQGGGNAANPQVWVDQQTATDVARLRFTVAGNGNARWDVGASPTNFAIYSATFGDNMMCLDQTGLTVNGTVGSRSDRNVKAGFEPVDARSILERVAAMPITRWHYTNDAATAHVGPMAQDFYAAFNVGPDDKHITTVDEEGVALVAIQGLNQKLTEKDSEIQDLKQSVAELKKMVQSLAEKK